MPRHCPYVLPQEEYQNFSLSVRNRLCKQLLATLLIFWQHIKAVLTTQPERGVLGKSVDGCGALVCGRVPVAHSFNPQPQAQAQAQALAQAQAADVDVRAGASGYGLNAGADVDVRAGACG